MSETLGSISDFLIVGDPTCKKFRSTTKGLLALGEQALSLLWMTSLDLDPILESLQAIDHLVLIV